MALIFDFNHTQEQNYQKILGFEKRFMSYMNGPWPAEYNAFIENRLKSFTTKLPPPEQEALKEDTAIICTALQQLIENRINILKRWTLNKQLHDKGNLSAQTLIDGLQNVLKAEQEHSEDLAYRKKAGSDTIPKGLIDLHFELAIHFSSLKQTFEDFKNKQKQYAQPVACPQNKTVLSFAKISGLYAPATMKLAFEDYCNSRLGLENDPLVDALTEGLGRDKQQAITNDIHHTQTQAIERIRTILSMAKKWENTTKEPAPLLHDFIQPLQKLKTRPVINSSYLTGTLAQYFAKTECIYEKINRRFERLWYNYTHAESAKAQIITFTKRDI